MSTGTKREYAFQSVDDFQSKVVFSFFDNNMTGIKNGNVKVNGKIIKNISDKERY